MLNLDPPAACVLGGRSVQRGQYFTCGPWKDPLEEQEDGKRIA
jgi:hypothetical protein